MPGSPVGGGAMGIIAGRKAPGEVEARTVQERAERGNYTSHPMQTEGYPTNQQIVKFRDGRDAQLIPIDHDPFQAPKWTKFLTRGGSSNCQ